MDDDGDVIVSESEFGQILLFKCNGGLSFTGPFVIADEGKHITVTFLIF